jgi:hypothetical protein
VLVSAGIDPQALKTHDPFLGVLFKQEGDVAAAQQKRRPF